jgi:hypothetical protein
MFDVAAKVSYQGGVAYFCKCVSVLLLGGLAGLFCFF